MQQNVGFCLHSQSVSLWVLLFVCLFVFYVELSPLILRDIKKKRLLIPVIFVVRGGILFMWISSLMFVGKLFSCFF